MDILTWVIVAALLALIVFKLKAGYRSASQLQLIADAVARGAVLVDVRTPGEFGTGHLPKARNIPVQGFDAQASSLGKKSRPVVIYCASGTRSASAASTLRRAGYTDVLDLGPMRNWERLPKGKR